MLTCLNLQKVKLYYLSENTETPFDGLHVFSEDGSSFRHLSGDTLEVILCLCVHNNDVCMLLKNVGPEMELFIPRKYKIEECWWYITVKPEDKDEDAIIK